MAKNKKSFLLYADYKPIFDSLTNEEAGQLIKHLLAYVSDENPKTDNRIIQIAFEPIKQQLKRDLVKWAEIREKRSDAGKEGMKKRYNNHQRNLTSLTSDNKPQQLLTNITVNVNDNVNDIYKEIIESQIWMEQKSMLIKSRNLENTKRLLKAWLLEQGSENLNRSIEEIKRHFVNSMFKKIEKEGMIFINPNLGHNLQGTM